MTGTVLYFVGDSASSEQASEAALQPWITGSNIGVSGTF
ncbi:MAG: hypothetical protein RL685_1034 [Pseudomonadota bacterium]